MREEKKETASEPGVSAIVGARTAVVELFTPDCSASGERADSASVLDAAVSGPAANLAQSHSASRFGLDPMRPSDETERVECTPALEV
jgi:hypothetical protein